MLTRIVNDDRFVEQRGWFGGSPDVAPSASARRQSVSPHAHLTSSKGGGGPSCMDERHPWTLIFTWGYAFSHMNMSIHALGHALLGSKTPSKMAELDDYPYNFPSGFPEHWNVVRNCVSSIPFCWGFCHPRRRSLVCSRGVQVVKWRNVYTLYMLQ